MNKRNISCLESDVEIEDTINFIIRKMVQNEERNFQINLVEDKKQIKKIEEETKLNNSNKQNIKNNNNFKNVWTIHDYSNDEKSMMKSSSSVVSCNGSLIRQISNQESKTQEKDLIKERRTLYVKPKCIQITQNEKKKIEKGIKDAFKQGLISKKVFTDANHFLNNNDIISTVFIEKMSDQQLKEAAMQNIDKRCEKNGGKLLAWIGSKIRNSILKTKTFTSFLSCMFSGVVTSIGIEKLVSPLIGKVVLLEANESINLNEAIEVCPGLYQLIATPSESLTSLLVSNGVFMIGSLSFAFCLSAMEGDLFVRDEIETVKKNETYFNNLGLTWNEGKQLEKMEEDFFLEWDKKRKKLLLDWLGDNSRCNSKDLNDILNKLDKQSHVLYDFVSKLEWPEFKEALNNLDNKLIEDDIHKKNEFIEICKKNKINK